MLKLKSDILILPVKHLLKSMSNSFDLVFIVVSRIICKHYCRPNFAPPVGLQACSLQLQAGVLWHRCGAQRRHRRDEAIDFVCYRCWTRSRTDRQTDTHFITRSKSIRPLVGSERITRKSCPPNARHFATTAVIVMHLVIPWITVDATKCIRMYCCDMFRHFNRSWWV